VKNVLKTRITAEKEESRRALVVQQVGRRRKAVPNAKRVVRGCLVMLLAKIAKIAWRDNTVQVNMKTVKIPIQQRVSVAPLVLVKVIEDKLRAYRAAPVNSPMSLVL